MMTYNKSKTKIIYNQEEIGFLFFFKCIISVKRPKHKKIGMTKARKIGTHAIFTKRTIRKEITIANNHHLFARFISF